MLIENTPGLSNIAISAFTQQASVGRDRTNTSPGADQKSPLEQKEGSYTDSVEISEEAKNRAGIAQTSAEAQLTEEELKQLKELKSRDQEVRTHEQQHRSRGGQFIRGTTQYKYQRGPDGQMYAVGGEVQIDTSEVPDNPEATIRKMQSIRAAALAPADPSPADRRVAAEATRKEAKARAELQDEGRTEATEATKNATKTGAVGKEEETSSNESGGGPSARGSIQPYLNNERVAFTPGEYLNVFA